MPTINKRVTTSHISNKQSQVTTIETASHDLINNKPLNVLITRPEPKAQELALLLNEQGIVNSRQALFTYSPLASSTEIVLAIKSAEFIIFVSAAAVNFAQARYPLTGKLPNTIFAVGQATKQALLNLGIDNIVTPAAGHENSEGLLNLPELTNIKGKSVLICRGNGGREHLGDSLARRGANISYIETYQRVWQTLAKNCVEQWRAQQINCIVVTSNDILLTLYEQLKHFTQDADAVDDYWQSQCLWVVVSERLETNAKKLGFTRVINARGASSKTLCNTLQALA